MKNFKAIREFVNKTYYSGLELFCTGLATVLNKGLRQLIIAQGKDPDYVKPPIKQLIDEEFNKLNWGLPQGYLRGTRVQKSPKFIQPKKEVISNKQIRLEPSIAPTIVEVPVVEVIVPLETVATPAPTSDIELKPKPKKRSAKKRTAP